ncbi:hypothetical protein CORC01_01993, partial [Colletotrichum orchidophilum]
HPSWHQTACGCLLPRLPRANPHSVEGHLLRQRASLGDVSDPCCSLSTCLAVGRRNSSSSC